LGGDGELKKLYKKGYFVQIKGFIIDILAGEFLKS
jgi:hypothetical protein